MIGQMIIDGLLHIVHIRKDSNKEQRTARVHVAATNEPVAVLTEVDKNKFKNTASNETYNLNPMTRVFGL